MYPHALSSRDPPCGQGNMDAYLVLRVQLIAETRRVSEAPDEAMLGQLRELEVKMGLVLTLVRYPLPIVFVRVGTALTMSTTCAAAQFKASVWAVINEQPVDDMSGLIDATPDETIRQ